MTFLLWSFRRVCVRGRHTCPSGRRVVTSGLFAHGDPEWEAAVRGQKRTAVPVTARRRVAPQRPEPGRINRLDERGHRGRIGGTLSPTS